MVKQKRIPIKITPCPITEAILEIRFDSKYPDEAVFGILYKDFSNTFPNLTPTPLPILNIPELIRKQDLNFKFQPHYSLKQDNLSLQIGPKVISLINTGEYIGWGTFSRKFREYLEIAQKGDVFESITRIGLRYVNFFDNNILLNSDLTIKLPDEEINSQNIFLKTIFQSGQFKSLLQIANDANFILNGKNGSVLDIDTYIEQKILFSQVNQLLETGHAEEKKLFYGLLQQSFIDGKLNPEYT